jgi:ABC-type transport system substrate-binding protein
VPRPLALLLTLLAAALLLPGCRPDAYPSEEGVVLHAYLDELPKSLDPPLVGENASAKLTSQVYEGLLEYHPYAQPYQLRPAVAAAMPEVSEDGLVYTFRLRDGVTFHDDPCFPDGQGREVTAHDFVWAFKRFGHPGVLTKGWWLFDGKVAGFDDWREDRKAELEAARMAGGEVDPLTGIEADVAGIRALDDRTLQIELTGPYPQFLWVLAMTYTAVYPKEAVDFYGDEFRNHPVGTGPFRIQEFNPVYRAVFEANPEYRENRVPDPVNRPEDRWEGWEAFVDTPVLARAGERIPLVDGMEVRFILEAQPRWLYFKAGNIDWINPPKDNADEVLQDGRLTPDMQARGVVLDPWAELGTVYLAFNMLDPVVGDNADLRRAIAMALDHRWMIDNLYAGQAVLATSPVPPGVAGYTDDPAASPTHSADGSPRIEQAKALLAEAGYPGGVDPQTGEALRLQFEMSGTSTTNRQFANRIKDDLRRIGIEVTPITNTFPQLVEKMRGANFQFTQLAWGFDYPDAQNILQLLYGPNKAPGIGGASFQDPEFDALYARAATLQDGPERTALYEQMTRIVGDQVPWVPRVHRVRNNLQQPWLQGFRFTEVHDQSWSYASVDVEMRDRLVAEWNEPVLWPVGLAGGVFIVGIAGTVLVGRRRSA